MSAPKASIAATRPVNPSGVSPTLTADQLWKGLVIKSREPQRFLEFFESCEIVKDEGTLISRRAKTKTGQIIEEDVHLYEPTICYFESGSFRVTNIISYDSAGELQLTFSFCNGIPGPNPDEALTNPVVAANKVGEGAVNHTLEAVRALVRSGEIQ
ncbi:DUF1857-domain-containing protein [Stereum hirsutum FP-91666 SS1]|uniref:DUF1857-domain-containing protein n=1 Tax=Stereum hirsutum (strain FP-91666) TaxID=721885 RepID=UPI000444976F|nr:DUF1857-domain-containing protein [Stereum hirsutum FP-91666 SS1]EIM84096.1 DUF1857-domain-containing protein [Stereum hirsutum FP-91666 SS1]